MGNLVLFWGFTKQGLQCLAAAGAAELSLYHAGYVAASLGTKGEGKNKTKNPSRG